MSDNVDRTNLERSATMAHVTQWPCCIVVLFINSRYRHYLFNVHLMIIFIYWFWFLRLCSYFMIYCHCFYFSCLVLALLGIQILGSLQSCEKRLLVRHVCLSVCPSACNNSAPSRRIFMKFVISVLFKHLSRKFEFHLKSHKKRARHMNMFFWQQEIFQTKCVEKIKTQLHNLDIWLALHHSITFLLLPTWYTNFLFIHINYIK